MHISEINKECNVRSPAYNSYEKKSIKEAPPPKKDIKTFPVTVTQITPSSQG